MPGFRNDPAEIADILSTAKTVAVVGCSPKPGRPSHDIAVYLDAQGYRVVPVNPGHRQILGWTCHPSLADVPGPVDLVNVFRQPEAVPEIVDQALAKKAKALWLQIGVVHEEAARRARAAGLVVVMDACIMVEHGVWRRGGK
ncbi:MAG: CoA-binding protein [Elusimicrobiota bacterium]